MLEGAFLLLILYTNEPQGNKGWPNPWGPFEFSTYEDCRLAGMLAFANTHKDMKITCTNKKTGYVAAEWVSGELNDQNECKATKQCEYKSTEE